MSLPSIILKNQFGEQSNNTIVGGSQFMWCNAIVDAPNGNGFGVRSFKSSGLAGHPDIVNMYMNTSSTPVAGSPNPAAGLILLKFAKSFAGYINGFSGQVSPLSGSSVAVTTGLTNHQVYVITSVGTTTAAQWQTLGLPVNVVPAVGASFIAITAVAGSGTGTVQTILATGSLVTHIEVLGDPNQTCNNTPAGAQLILGCFGVAPGLIAPAAGSVIGLAFSYSQDPAPLI